MFGGCAAGTRAPEQVFGVTAADAVGRDIDEVVPLVDGAWTDVLATDGARPRVLAVTRGDRPLQFERGGT